jgi:hypothetical protein
MLHYSTRRHILAYNRPYLGSYHRAMSIWNIKKQNIYSKNDIKLGTDIGASNGRK